MTKKINVENLEGDNEALTATETPDTIFPTPADTEGWFYEDADDRKRGVQTKTYPNNSVVKRFYISTGEEVIVRKLKGKDMITANRISGKDADETENGMALAAVASTINGKPLIYEFLKEMFIKDTMLILSVSTLLNFS